MNRLIDLVFCVDIYVNLHMAYHKVAQPPLSCLIWAGRG